MYMLYELMYMYMFIDIIVFRDERNVKIILFLLVKIFLKVYCVIVYGGLNIFVLILELIFIRSIEFEILMKFVL